MWTLEFAFGIDLTQSPGPERRGNAFSLQFGAQILSLPARGSAFPRTSDRGVAHLVGQRAGSPQAGWPCSMGTAGPQLTGSRVAISAYGERQEHSPSASDEAHVCPEHPHAGSWWLHASPQGSCMGLGCTQDGFLRRRQISLRSGFQHGIFLWTQTVWSLGCSLSRV